MTFTTSVYLMIAIFFTIYVIYFSRITRFYKKSRTFKNACGVIDRPKYEAISYYLSGLKGFFIFLVTIFSIFPLYLAFKGFIYSSIIIAFIGFFIFITGVIYSKSNKVLTGIFYKVSIYSPVTFFVISIISIYIEYYYNYVI